MNRTRRILFIAAALLCGLGLAAVLSHRERAAGSSPVSPAAPPAASASRRVPPSLSGIAAAAPTGPVEFSRDTPNAIERPRAATREDAEQRFDAAMDRLERTVSSVMDFGNPAPTDAERHRVIEQAVSAYLDIAEHVSREERAQRYAEMHDGLTILAALDDDGLH